jgi:hypothetical protein
MGECETGLVRGSGVYYGSSSFPHIENPVWWIEPMNRVSDGPKAAVTGCLECDPVGCEPFVAGATKGCTAKMEKLQRAAEDSRATFRVRGHPWSFTDPTLLP